MARRRSRSSRGIEPPRLDPRDRRALVAWYAAHRRDLPWRRTRDPYAIWISEAMLQQTRVETVLAYWPRFLARFPDVRALARASESDVLAAWSGLGYYARARRLREAARAIVAHHAGEFPRDLGAARALPGVGPYTAGAVLSIAFGAAEALVDGNVERVLARCFARDSAPSETRRWAWDVARELVPRDGSAGDWNQALMELGASVCTPRAPRCGECPLSKRCEALAHGLVDSLPRARPRPEPVDVELAIAVVAQDDSLLLEQRPPRGRMASLWQFPSAELARGDREPSGLFPPEMPRVGGRPLAVRGEPLGELCHTITRHRIRARVLRAAAPRGDVAPPLAWIPRARIGELALTGMARKVLASGLAGSQREPRGSRGPAVAPMSRR